MSSQLNKNRRFWQLVALSLAMLLPSLGTSIANVALPTLASSFAAPLHDVQWVVLSYLLVTTSLIVGAGRLGDRFGRKRVLLVGIAIFAAASAGSAFTGGLWQLILARGLQGIGAAIMMSLTLAAASDMVAPERTGRVMGLLGTMSAVGTALGPSLGGALIAWFGWPAVFGFLAAAGTIAFMFGAVVFPADRSTDLTTSSVDWAGTLLLALALGCYALTMTPGAAVHGAATVVLACVTALGFAAFAVLETCLDAPLIRMDLLRDRSLTSSLIAMTLVSTVMMATLVVGPFYLTQVLALDSIGTGLVMSVGPTIAALAGVPAGRLVDRIGSTKTIIAGLGGVAAGSALMVLLPGTFRIGGYVSALAVITTGYALFQAANNPAVMKSVAADQRGLTGALLGLSRNLGLITGASAMGAIFSWTSQGIALLRLDGGGQAGMELTFVSATALAGLALLVFWWGTRTRGDPEAASFPAIPRQLRRSTADDLRTVGQRVARQPSSAIVCRAIVRCAASPRRRGLAETSNYKAPTMT